MELPKGIHGVVLREQPCPEGLREDEDVTSFWAAETSFQDITVMSIPCFGVKISQFRIPKNPAKKPDTDLYYVRNFNTCDV